MDQAIRNKLRGVVTQCRRLLEDSVRDELQGKFGVYAAPKSDDVQVEDDARMTHLGDEERAARKDILDHFAHIKARGFKPKESLDQLIREVAFTHLNRFCAYKMMEARQVFVGDQRFREAVSRGVNSNGVKFYLADHPDDERLFTTGKEDVAYRHFLDWLGGLLSEEIGVLFSPHDPANRLYPPQRVLDEVLALINDEALADIWTQDETIGWVYQYFTPKELRDQARKESQAPRNSYELAFRNQFFTPRYVVEFLTDNTLGRIWYEMRKGVTKLKDQCRYMVRRPSEVFLAEGQKPPEDAAKDRDDLPQAELLKLPVYISHRSKKDPRELKILDPACGSGHFLLYCFDLLLTIYEEAYADPDLGPALHRVYPTMEALQRDVPRLILAHNLHGIDIDLRASQIAALALWLRCQRAYQDMGLKKDRPKITRSNFVCAEPMPGEEHMLKEFVGQIQPKLLGQLVEVVFDKMKLAGEAGSLLKIEEDIRDAVAEARKQWLSGPVSIQRSLFDDDKPVVKQQRFDFSGVTDAQFFEQAETKVVDALRDYAEKAQNGQRLQRRLFSEDAVRGFAFVDLCHKRFDVVLMNPPFGSPSLLAESYLHRTYTDSRYECYGQFLRRTLTLCTSFIGAITSRGFLYLANFKGIRDFVYPRLDTVLDLGEGVLDDAMVEVAAYILNVNKRDQQVDCLNARNSTLSSNAECTTDGSNPVLACPRYLCDLRHISNLDNSPFCYTTPPELLRLFNGANTVDRVLGGSAKVGLATGDNDRFVRCYWEVPNTELNKRWRWHAKGGEYLPFKDDIHLVVDWLDNGKPIEEAFVGARIKKTDVYFRPGVTYTLRSLKGLSFRVLPSGCICSNKGPVIIAKGHEYALLSLANSAIFKYLVDIQCAFGAYEIGTVQRAPLPKTFTKEESGFANLGKGLVSAYSELSTLDETDVLFNCLLARSAPSSIVAYATGLNEVMSDARNRAAELLSELDQVASRAYGVNELPNVQDEHDKMLECFCLEEAQYVACRQMISLSVGIAFGRFEHSDLFRSPDRLDAFAPLPVHDFARCDLLTTSSQSPACFSAGIGVDDPEHNGDLIRHLRSALEVMWKDRAESIEKEACGILGVKELRDYFRKPGKGGFWDDHVARYSKSRRKAPIYWMLQSSKKNYAIWLYYHRLDKDLLFKALVNYVEPKIRLETSRLETLRTQSAAAGGSGREAKRLGKEVERQEEFLSELRDFEDKLRRAANLHLEPDLNDGVVLNIAPLHELVPWNTAKSYWQELLDGKYEWSSIGKQLREKGIIKG